MAFDIPATAKTSAPPPRRLRHRPTFAVIPVYRATLGAVRRNRGALLRALPLPAVIMGISEAAAPWTDGLLLAETTRLLVGALAYATFAVACQRIVLLGPASLPSRWGATVGRREIRYLLATAIVSALLLGPLLVASYFPIVYEISSRHRWVPGGEVLVLTGTVATTYLATRLMLIGPAIATDRLPTGFGEVLRWSRGCSWKLVGAFGAPPIVLGVAVAIVSMSLLQTAAWTPAWLVVLFGLLGGLMEYAMEAFMAALSSVLYRSLTRQAGLPAIEPAGQETAMTTGLRRSLGNRDGEVGSRA